MKKFLLISILLAPQVVFGESEKDKCIKYVTKWGDWFLDSAETGVSVTNNSEYAYQMIMRDDLRKKCKATKQDALNNSRTKFTNTTVTQEVQKWESCTDFLDDRSAQECSLGAKLGECAPKYVECLSGKDAKKQVLNCYISAVKTEICEKLDNSANTSSKTQAQKASASGEQKAKDTKKQEREAKKDAKKQEKDQKKVTNDKTNTSSNTAQPVAGAASAVAPTTKPTKQISGKTESTATTDACPQTILDQEHPHSTGITLQDGECQLTCEPNYIFSSGRFACIPDTSKSCESSDPNAKEAKITTLKTSGETVAICSILSCNPGYNLNRDNNTCILQSKDAVTASNESKVTTGNNPVASATQITNDANSKDGTECNTDDVYAERAEYDCVENTCSCKIQTCKTGYTPSIDGKSCVEKKCECGQIWDKNNRQCIADSRDGKACPNAKKGIKSGTYQCVDEEMTCIVDKCSDGYRQDGFLGNDGTYPTKCVSIQGDDCTEQFSNKDTNAVIAKYKKVNNKLDCVITKCAKDYTPSDDGKTCEQTEGDCPTEQLPQYATEGKLHRGKCKATKCDPGYMVESGECVELSGSCKPTTDPNAKSGHLTYDEKENQEICVIDSCKKYYKLSEDGKSCVLSNAHSEEELKEKSDNVNKLRDNEQSLANRMTSAVSMGATGIGGMMLAQSLSEQRVDKESEQDMDAYLATFRCEYAGGNPVPGGTIGAQLPADKLFDLYQEYVTLAADVQEAKSQLGLKPGIESEVVLDKANIALYDDTSTGTTNGTYASLYRALSDSSSMDAQKWNDQKAQTNKNLKIGIGVVAGGAALGEVGNILTNYIDWDNSEAPNMFKEGLKSIGMTNVDKLKLNNIDWGKIDVSKIDFSKLTSLKGRNAFAEINTTNQTSFEKSLTQLGILQ